MSENELGKKWDRCLADGAIKLDEQSLTEQAAGRVCAAIKHRTMKLRYLSGSGTGLGLGIVISVLFFKRHTWPISFGSGTGLGMAYANCQNDLRSQYLQHRSEKE